VDVTVSARHIDISPALRAAAEEKLGRLSRFGSEFERAEVHFLEERNPRIAQREVCDIMVEGHGRRLRARAAAADAFAAVDLVIGKLEHQLHTLKTKVVPRKQGARRKLLSIAGADD
jgi:ribosomal subunit interface protein